MLVTAQRLEAELARRLPPVILISGDVPLLVQEAGDLVRSMARKQGYAERELFTVDRSFDWAALEASLMSPSLFASRRLVELRVPGGKPGKEGGRVLADYAGKPDPDLVLLVVAPRLDARSMKTVWVKALEGVGTVCRLWPPERRDLPGWVARRMQRAGMQPVREAAALLAERVEGNLLAAHQEIEKLALLTGGGPVDAQAVMAAVTDSARFDVFQLADAVLAGDAARALRVLGGLRSEGLEPPVVLWAIARELRVVARFHALVADGESAARACSRLRVWKNRQALVQRAAGRLDRRRLHRLLRRAAGVDRVIKGVERGDAWAAVTDLVLAAVVDRRGRAA